MNATEKARGQRGSTGAVTPRRGGRKGGGGEGGGRGSARGESGGARGGGRGADGWVTALFSGAIFVGAAMLFLVQPMVGKMVLPKLGGSPAVWNTCMVFFQGALLAGYAYAHGLVRLRRVKIQALGHLVVVAVAGATLPVMIPKEWKPATAIDGVATDPAAPLLAILAAYVAIPFIVVATTGPLVQSWYSKCGVKGSKDPYFLYAASNAGSLLGLLGYPFLIEPLLTVPQQVNVWTGLYVVYGVLILACGTVASGRSALVASEEAAAADRRTQAASVLTGASGGAALGGGEDGAENRGARVVESEIAKEGTGWLRKVGRRAMWVVLSLVPSSLMLGVTQHISTDVAAVPMLWVVPLSIYLLSFVVAFSKWSRWVLGVSVLGTIVGVFSVLVMRKMEMTGPLWAILGSHLTVLTCGCVMCHTRLARLRPAASGLTEYYLLMSVGGVIGGILNSLVAPRVFDTIAEYWLCVAALGALIPAYRWPVAWLADRVKDYREVSARAELVTAAAGGRVPVAATAGMWRRLGSISLDMVVPLVVLTIALNVRHQAMQYFWSDPSSPMVEASWWVDSIAAPALVLVFCLHRPVRAGLGLLVLMVWATMLGSTSTVLYRSRTFFGVYQVMSRTMSLPDDPNDSFKIVTLMHGTTNHGSQSYHPKLVSVPQTYYHPDGPIGEVMRCYEGKAQRERVAVVGLGSGSMALYAGPKTRVDFYEIDPEVVRIAIAPELFTFVEQGRAKGEVRFLIGDGRVRLGDAKDGEYGIIALDAFSSDAIPVHLLTKEAIQLYFEKLAPGGILCIHITNRFLELEHPLFAIAQELGLFAVGREDRFTTDTERRDKHFKDGRYETTWVVLARSPSDLMPLAEGRLWVELQSPPVRRVRPWTDDYCNILQILK